MNDEPTLDSELRDRIRGLQAPLPDPSFRERNRKRFTGHIPYESDEDLRFPPVRSRGWLWSGVGVAAAAALAIVLFMGSGGASWEVWDVPEGGSIRVNGDEIASADTRGVELAPSSRVRGSDLGTVTLGVEQAVTMVLAPGTEVTVGSSGFLPGSRTLHATVREGTAWGSTGPEFPGNGMWIETDQARIHVTGTTFAVVSGGDSTCVCVLAGDVAVECKLTGIVDTVAPDRQLYLSSAGADARRLTKLTPAQRERLIAVRDRAAQPLSSSLRDL